MPRTAYVIPRRVDPGFHAGWGRENYHSKSNRRASRNWEILRLALARMIFPTQDCTATQDFMQAEPVSIMYRNQKGKLLELGSIQAGGSGDYFPTQGNKCSIPKHHTKAEEKIFLGQNVSHTANCATEKTPRRRFFCRRADPGVTCEEISDCSRCIARGNT